MELGTRWKSVMEVRPDYVVEDTDLYCPTQINVRDTDVCVTGLH